MDVSKGTFRQLLFHWDQKELLSECLLLILASKLPLLGFSYINNKMTEYGKVESFRRQPLDTQSVLLQLNIADDYFKAKKQIVILEEEIQTKEKELYNLKHELIASQIKLENSEKNIKSLQHELNESSKKIIRLETELKN